MKWSISLISVFFLTAFAVGDEKGTWKKVSSKDGKYEVEFPGEPQERPTKKGYMLEALGGKAVHIVEYTPRPQPIDLAKTAEVKAFFDQIEKGMEKSLKGKTLTSKETTVGDKKYPARHVDLDAGMLGIYRARLIFTGSVLYQVVVLGPKDYVDSAEVKKYLESFKLTD